LGAGSGTDDWFSDVLFATGSGEQVIDTTGASMYYLQLLAAQNISFTKRMAQPKYIVKNGYLWYDAVYNRDYTGGAGLKDTTAFTGSNKNGQSPASWSGGAANVLAKNDIIDGYGHARRLGTNTTDHLWLFLGVSIVGTNGSRYLDMELYHQPLTYDATTGVFTPLGTDGGHDSWIFNADGSIASVGDMIIAVEFSSSSFTADIRIWVSEDTYDNVDPLNFDFGAEFDGDGNNAPFGYADVVPESTGTVGCAIWNDAGTGVTPAPPWGTLNPSGNWSADYSQDQFLEIALDLSEIGIDPALYTGDVYDMQYQSLYFKSRSSASFTASLKDFCGPYPFIGNPPSSPVANPDTFNVPAGSSNNVLNVVANDTDADGDLDPSSVAVIFNPSSGGVAVPDGNGNIIYTPPVGFCGQDSLVYRVCDSISFCDSTYVIIDVYDAAPPTITCPADITQTADAGSCDAAIIVPAPVTDDDCGVASVENDYNNTSDASDTYPVGTTTVTWTVTDNDGKTNSCQHLVTVTDDENPNAQCQDITVYLDGAGNAVINALQVDNGSTDNCAIDTIYVNPDTLYCSDIGTNTVTLTVVDESGNSATCTSTVTVNDTISPVITCPANDTV
ncbi:MAG: HYR domain-containing protein, partial [Bacteroidales bacterium]|nr:HYR domain-containing protein [Bacteroidales bacterium]